MKAIFNKKRYPFTKQSQEEVTRKEHTSNLLAYAETGNFEAVLKTIEQQGNLIINLSDQNGKTPLHLSAMNGHLKIVEFLVQHGADCNFQDNYGWTPLHSAACSGSLEVLWFLLQQDEVKGENLNYPILTEKASVFNDDNNLPLHYLAKNPCANNEHLPDVVKLMIDVS